MFSLSRAVIFALGILTFIPEAISYDAPPSHLPVEKRQDSASILINHGPTSQSVSLSSLEQSLPMYAVKGLASPDETLTEYQGVLMSDVLRKVGASEAKVLTLRATDGYAVEIARKDWEKWPLLIATRHEDAPLKLRSRGPARLIYPIELYPEISRAYVYNKSIWMLEVIEW